MQKLAAATSLLLLSIDDAVASAVPSPDAATFTNVDVLKLVIIPLFMVFVVGILLNAIARYNLITNLECEIATNVAWFINVAGSFIPWKTRNIESDPTKPVDEIESIRWNNPLLTVVYDNAQADMRQCLWGAESVNVHSIYDSFSLLHNRIGSLAKEVDDAKKHKVFVSETLLALDNATDEKLQEISSMLSADAARRQEFIADYANTIQEELENLCACKGAQHLAESLFRRAYMLLYALAVVILIIALYFLIKTL